jgi:hypothetical protein
MLWDLKLMHTHQNQIINGSNPGEAQANPLFFSGKFLKTISFVENRLDEIYHAIMNLPT